MPLALRGRELWHRTAPAALRAGEFKSEKQAWKLWKRHLARRPANALSRLWTQWPDLLNWSLPRRPHTLAAAVADGSMSESTLAAAELAVVDPRAMARKPRRLEAHCRKWLAHASDSAHDPRAALDALAWAYALPKLVDELSGELWWQVLDQLIDLAGGDHRRPARNCGLVGQLLSTELPLALAFQFPEIKPCRRLAKRTGPSLEFGLTESLAADGMPRPAMLAELSQRFACWLRASALARRLRRDPWDDAARQRLAHGVRQAARLIDARGCQFVASCDRAPWPRSLWRLCVREFGARRDRAVLESHRSPRPALSRTALKRLPEPSAQSDGAALAVLRSSWSPRAITLAVEHASRAVEFELALAGDPLLAGQWHCEVTIDGAPRQLVTGWEANCWVTDRDVAYLELEASLAGDVRVFRQLLLAREDQFLFLADAVVARQADSIAYRGRIPCAAGTSAMPVADHTEASLVTGKNSFAVLPLALPEWRRQCAREDLAASQAEVQLSQEIAGRALYAPLWIDLDPRHARHPYTWRQLSIAEDRQAVPTTAAAGFRVQCGSRQWLFYRSLGQRAGRTVLGVHLWSEFLASRFNRDGESDTLIEVE
ncbi:MAG: hypothetical protein K2Y37_20210 [Pirellulales bacterium]|nr:hypothetical protein [Pirellulales bacterium]